MRMNADGSVDPVVLLSDADGAIECAWSSAAADRQNGSHACAASAFEHFRAICVESRTFEMRVRIDQHYFSRAPMGTSSRKLARTGWPLSPTEAATIMPFDSMPRSLRGWRLATITTFMP